MKLDDYEYPIADEAREYQQFANDYKRHKKVASKKIRDAALRGDGYVRLSFQNQKNSDVFKRMIAEDLEKLGYLVAMLDTLGSSHLLIAVWDYLTCKDHKRLWRLLLKDQYVGGRDNNDEYLIGVDSFKIDGEIK